MGSGPPSLARSFCARRAKGGHICALAGHIAIMTEAEACAALAANDAIGGIEPWIASQRWQAVPDGWTVAGELQGWRFRVEAAPGGLRVVMSARGRAGGVVRA